MQLCIHHGAGLIVHPPHCLSHSSRATAEQSDRGQTGPTAAVQEGAFPGSFDMIDQAQAYATSPRPDEMVLHRKPQ